MRPLEQFVGGKYVEVVETKANGDLVLEIALPWGMTIRKRDADGNHILKQTNLFEPDDYSYQIERALKRRRSVVVRAKSAAGIDRGLKTLGSLILALTVACLFNYHRLPEVPTDVKAEWDRWPDFGAIAEACVADMRARLN